MEITASQMQEKVDRIAAAARANFSEASVGDTCIICPGKPREAILKITWKAKVPKPLDANRAGRIAFMVVFQAVLEAIFGKPRYRRHRTNFSDDDTIVTFDTYHPISLEGLGILERHRQISGITRETCNVLTLASSVGLAAGIIWIWGAWLEGGRNPHGWLLAIASLCLLIASLIWANRARSYGLPTNALESIAQSPIEMESWAKVG